MLGKNNQNITNVVGTGAPARPDWTKWILSGIVLMLIILPSTRVSAFKGDHECWGNSIEVDGKKYIEGITLAECHKACEEDDSCQFFDYTPYGGRRTPYKKGHECWGNTFEVIEGGSLAECSAKCEENKECQFFDYAPAHRREGGSRCELASKCDPVKEADGYNIYKGWDPSQQIYSNDDRDSRCELASECDPVKVADGYNTYVSGNPNSVKECGGKNSEKEVVSCFKAGFCFKSKPDACSDEGELHAGNRHKEYYDGRRTAKRLALLIHGGLLSNATDEDDLTFNAFWHHFPGQWLNYGDNAVGGDYESTGATGHWWGDDWCK